jgi:alkylation response protein AidB-like acyl-CoA dehydrogenase
MGVAQIQSPHDPTLEALCRQLADAADDVDRSGRWPAEQLKLCGEAGVYRWFLEKQDGGVGWSPEDSIRGYIALASASLTTAFILTQRTGACRRIAASRNDELRRRLLPGLASGELFATVGISHLTTSRRHLGRPVLAARRTPTGFQLDGMSPWVTGGGAADVIVMAATLLENGEPSGQDLLLAVPTDLAGVAVEESFSLVGLTPSSTGPVRLDHVEVPAEWLIAGPAANVMLGSEGGSTGGYETSALALGLARAAIDYLSEESIRRPELAAPTEALAQAQATLADDLLGLVRGDTRSTKESVRQRANSLVLRATQGALSAAKGSGYVLGHPVGRWCREALFFLVWSCPPPVAAANLRELAGLAE